MEVSAAKSNTIEYNGFKASLEGKVLTVSKDGEEREYDIKQKNDGIEYDKTQPEYFFIRTKNFYYNFKFEEDNLFVGDKFDNDNQHMDEFACHVFGE